MVKEGFKQPGNRHRDAAATKAKSLAKAKAKADARAVAVAAAAAATANHTETGTSSTTGVEMTQAEIAADQETDPIPTEEALLAPFPDESTYYYWY